VAGSFAGGQTLRRWLSAASGHRTRMLRQEPDVVKILHPGVGDIQLHHRLEFLRHDRGDGIRANLRSGKVQQRRERGSLGCRRDDISRAHVDLHRHLCPAELARQPDADAAVDVVFPDVVSLNRLRSNTIPSSTTGTTATAANTRIKSAFSVEPNPRKSRSRVGRWVLSSQTTNRIAPLSRNRSAWGD